MSLKVYHDIIIPMDDEKPKKAVKRTVAKKTAKKTVKKTTPKSTEEVSVKSIKRVRRVISKTPTEEVVKITYIEPLSQTRVRSPGVLRHALLGIVLGILLSFFVLNYLPVIIEGETREYTLVKDYAFKDVKTQPFNPDFTDVNFDRFFEVWESLDETYVPPPNGKEVLADRDKILDYAIRGLVASKGDPYTSYLPKKEGNSFEEEIISGSVQGIGSVITIEDGVLTIVRVIKNTPSADSGLRAGDKIIKINGVETFENTLSESTGKIRGPEGTTVNLTVLRNGNEREFTIERRKFDVPNIETEIRDGVFIIKMTSVSIKTPRDLRNALREFVDANKRDGVDRILLDFRGNPGGVLSATTEIASFFLPRGNVILFEYNGSNDLKVFDSRGTIFANNNVPKITILVDGGTASSAEIIAAALRDNGVADIVGTKTLGKGSVQTLKGLSDGGILKVTVAHWLTPNKETVSKEGLKPDVDLEEQIREGLRTDEDFDITEFGLSEAIKHLRNK